jgi:FAD/FMN-containing dehydrogenase
LNLLRRHFLKAIAAAPVLAAGPLLSASEDVLVNDVHTGLNPTWVSNVARPSSVAEIQTLIKDCGKHGRSIAASGSRHATGGQQFATHSILLDMRGMNRVTGLDNKTGLLQVESGIEWPALIQGYLAAQGSNAAWGIRQKQGGANHMTLAGALSANAHGHCLGSAPMSADVEWIEMLTADGKLQKCNRKQNAELFSLGIGGYGLFGVITAVGVRLVPREKVRRRVEARTLAELVELVEKRATSGATFGYFQYSIDPSSAEFMRTGVLTTFEPVAPETELGKESAELNEEALTALLELAHRNPQRAYMQYAKYELALDGNVEWSDLHQLSTYPSGYHKEIEKRLGAAFVGADLILEVYVPRNELIAYLEDARHLLLTGETPLIYGTVRFIEQDRDTFLAWAKKRYACVIFTLHSPSEARSLRKTGELCRQLMRGGTKRGGSFYLTYNRFAGRDELDSAYPQFAEFLALKKKYDPTGLFQSDWFRHYKTLYQ